MDYELIQLIGTITSIIIIGYWQYHQINSLKTQISAYEGIINGLKSYTQIISADDFIKNRDVLLETQKKEFELNQNAKINEIIKSDKQFKMIMELAFANAFTLTTALGKEKALEVTDERFPESAELVRLVISQMHP